MSDSSPPPLVADTSVTSPIGVGAGAGAGAGAAEAPPPPPAARSDSPLPPLVADSPVHAPTAAPTEPAPLALTSPPAAAAAAAAAEPVTPPVAAEPRPPPPEPVAHVNLPADLDHALSAIYKVRPTVRDPVVKLLKQILGFVSRNPSEAKYRSLNIEKVVSKLAGAETAIPLLDMVGFAGNASATHRTLAAEASLDRLNLAYNGLLYKEYEYLLKKYQDREAAETQVAAIQAQTAAIRRGMADAKAADSAEIARRLAHFQGKETKAAPAFSTSTGVSRTGRQLDVLEQMNLADAAAEKKASKPKPKAGAGSSRLSKSGRPLDLLEQMDRDDGPSHKSGPKGKKKGMGDMMAELDKDKDAPAKRTGPKRVYGTDVMKRMELDEGPKAGSSASGPPRKIRGGADMMRALDDDRSDKPSHAKMEGAAGAGAPKILTGEERQQLAKKKGMDPERAARWEAQRKFAELRASGGGGD